MAKKARWQPFFLMALVAFLGGSAALRAEVGFGVILGIRDEVDNENEHSRAAFGLSGDFGPSAWFVRPEVALLTLLDPFDNKTRIEKSAGVVHSWRHPHFRIDLGGGYASVPSQGFYSDDYANAGYVHGKIEYTREEGVAYGLDLRYVKAEELEDEGDRFSVDYVQLSFVLHWHFKGRRAAQPAP